jgi:hypothetical protein
MRSVRVISVCGTLANEDHWQDKEPGRGCVMEKESPGKVGVIYKVELTRGRVILSIYKPTCRIRRERSLPPHVQTILLKDQTVRQKVASV